MNLFEKKINNHIKFEKFSDLSNYVNSSTFLNNLVYLKNNIKNSTIILENEVNLNETSHFETPSFTHSLKDDTDDTLIFESKFESGNLLAASKFKENEYQLLLQCDTNTVGYNQWFYFRVSNTRKKTKARFNMINQVN